MIIINVNPCGSTSPLYSKIIWSMYIQASPNIKIYQSKHFENSALCFTKIYPLIRELQFGMIFDRFTNKV
jgi:hypothetical protein